MACLPGLYAARLWTTKPTTAPYTYRYLALGDSLLTLARSRMTGYLRGNVPPRDDYIVLMLSTGVTTLDVTTHPERVVLGAPTLLDPAHQVEFEAENYDQRLVHLKKTFVDAVAAERQGTGRGRPILSRHAAPDPAALDQWASALESASAALRENGVASLLWHNAARATAAAFLDLFQPQTGPLPDALASPRYERLRHAVEYLHEHVAEPVMIADVANATGLSVRAIQEGFQRHFATTPMAYLRELRLDHVQQELLAQTPGVSTVGAIAHRWGFAHLGRFAGEYIRKFSEYPQTTLRRDNRSAPTDDRDPAAST